METNQPVEVVLDSIKAAEAHIRSEYVYDLAGTMATVGPMPHYAVTAEPGVVGVISGRDGVAALYEGAHNYAIPNASRFLTQISSDWYLFAENIPTRKWVADGSMRTVHTATLLITDSEGVKGEFVWERPASEAVTAGATGPLPLGQLRSVSLHEEFLAALRDGDATAIGSVLDPACTWAERNYLSDAEGGEILELSGSKATVSYLDQWARTYKPELVSVLNRQATDWYVFAEELWIVRPADGGDRRQYRKATIYPINPAGRIQAAIGFGTDLEAPSPRTDLCLGQAFWPEGNETGAPQARTRSPRVI